MPTMNLKPILLRALELTYIIALDAIVILLISTIAHVLSFALTKLANGTVEWSVGNVVLTLSDIVRYGDLFTFALFMLVATKHVLDWARRSAHQSRGGVDEQ